MGHACSRGNVLTYSEKCIRDRAIVLDSRRYHALEPLTIGFSASSSLQLALSHRMSMCTCSRRTTLDSNSSARRCARRPSPLEVMATEMAGDVDDFADEKQSSHSSTFHRLAR